MASPPLRRTHTVVAIDEVGRLVDHREDLVAERTRRINRLRWHLHELDPAWDPPARSLVRLNHLDAVAARLGGFDGPVARIATEVIAHVRQLTVRETELEREIAALVSRLAPTLLVLVGVARHNGRAPLPVRSGNRERHRLSRTGNRQLNAAIHRIAVTRMRRHDDARAYLDRRLANRKHQDRSATSTRATPLRGRRPLPARRRPTHRLSDLHRSGGLT